MVSISAASVSSNLVTFECSFLKYKVAANKKGLMMLLHYKVRRVTHSCTVVIPKMKAPLLSLVHVLLLGAHLL